MRNKDKGKNPRLNKLGNKVIISDVDVYKAC